MLGTIDYLVGGFGEEVMIWIMSLDSNKAFFTVTHENWGIGRKTGSVYSNGLVTSSISTIK